MTGDVSDQINFVAFCRGTRRRENAFVIIRKRFTRQKPFTSQLVGYSNFVDKAPLLRQRAECSPLAGHDKTLYREALVDRVA